MPQVHGAARQALAYVRSVLEVETNSATDNPLIFEDGRVVSGGNFHGQPVAQALDLLAIACVDLGAISERRIARLVDPALSGLPPFLSPDPGVHSGLMMAQIVAAALVAELALMLEEFGTRGMAAFADEWRAADSLADRRVRVLQDGREFDGMARGVDADGALLVEAAGGQRRVLSGEVSVRSA